MRPPLPPASWHATQVASSKIRRPASTSRAVPSRPARKGSRSASVQRLTKARVGAGVDGEKKASGAEFLGQGAAGDAGLNHAIHIFGVDRQDAVHAAKIDRDAAPDGQCVAFERGADTPGYDGAAVFRADPDDLLHLFGRGRVGDGIGRCGVKIAFILAVQIQIGLGARETIA